LSALYDDDNLCLTQKKQILNLRAKLIHSIRSHFIKHDFLEVETPLRIPSPAPEEHIEAIPSGNWFLQTSPEIYMKRLLAAGYPRIFQISKCFRAGERGNKHLPEYTMLEWYVSGFNYFRLMAQCEEILKAVFTDMGHAEYISWQDRKIVLNSPWEKITVADAFARHAKISCTEAIDKNQFEEVMVDFIEPNLGINRPTFLYDYPVEHAALAKRNLGHPDVAERFELYIGALEIANGFSELTDANEQKQRFEKALAARAKKKWAQYTMPEKFLSSLKNIPESAGIALGIDRLVMVLANTDCIDDVVTFTPEML